MNIFLEMSGALGGLVAFAAAVAVIVKAIFRQSSAVSDNTKALESLTQSVDSLKDGFINHGERIARLEALK